MSLQLYNAVNNNDLNHLQEVIMDDQDLDVNAAIMGSMTALHVAAEKGYSSCVKVLLSSGADVNLSDDNGYTALMNCSAAGWPLVVRALLQASKCNCVNNVTNSGLSALHMACKLGSTGITALLLQAGADPHLRSRAGETPVSLAIQNRSNDVAQLLLLGCTYTDPNAVLRTPGLPRPLYYVMKRQSYEVAKCILLAGYSSKLDINMFCQELPAGESLIALAAADDLLPSDRYNILFVIQNAYCAPSLQHLCRLAIRKALSYNIWEKSVYLNLPQSMKDYICFKDFYSPPLLNTEHEVSSFFAEHSELY